MAVGRFPVPGFPQWVGVTATIGHLTPDGDARLTADITLHITRRARLWALWRRLTGLEVTTNAPAHD